MTYDKVSFNTSSLEITLFPIKIFSNEHNFFSKITNKTKYYYNKKLIFSEIIIAIINYLLSP